MQLMTFTLGTGDFPLESWYFIPIGLAIVFAFAGTRYALDALNNYSARAYGSRPLSPLQALPAMLLLLWLAVLAAFGEDIARPVLQACLAATLLAAHLAAVATKTARQASWGIGLAAAGFALLGGVIFPIAFVVALANGSLGEFFRAGSAPQSDRSPAPQPAPVPPAAGSRQPSPKGSAALLVFVLLGIGTGAVTFAVVAAVHAGTFAVGASQTEGEVVGFVEQGRSSKPVIQYQVDDRTYKIQGLAPYAMGEKVRVRYYPEEPGAGWIHSFFEQWLFPLLFGGLGILMVGGGLWVLVARWRKRGNQDAEQGIRP
jgi:hypothetical protein